MASQRWVNNFATTFAAAVATGDTVLRLPSAMSSILGTLTGSDWMVMTACKLAGSVESNIEIVKVTNVDPNGGGDCLLTVVRAQEGTTAKAYLVGDLIAMRITAGGVNALASDAELATHSGNISNPHGVTKAQVGLANADNTADAAKPVSTAQQTALNLKANLASPTFTGTVAGITAAMVGAQPAGTYATGTGTATNTNTGDETTATIQSKLSITTLSGSNTGDQVLPTLGSLGAQASLVSGTNIKTVGGASLLGSGDVPVSMPVVTVSGTTQTAVAGSHYVLTNASATTVILPAGVSGATIAITTTGTLITNVVAPSGAETIMGVVGNMTIDRAGVTVTLRYLNSSWRIL